MIRRNKLRLLAIVLLCGSILDLPSSLAQNDDAALETNAEIQPTVDSNPVQDAGSSADKDAPADNDAAANKDAPAEYNAPVETSTVVENSEHIEAATTAGQDAGPIMMNSPGLTNPPAAVEPKVEAAEIPTTAEESSEIATQSAAVETSTTTRTTPSVQKTDFGGGQGEGGETTTDGPETTVFIETTTATTTTTTVPTTTEAINTTIPSVPYDVTMQNGTVTIRFNRKLNSRERRRVFDAILKRLNKNKAVKEAKSRPSRPQETTSGTSSEEGPGTTQMVLKSAVLPESLRRKRDTDDGDGQSNVFTDDNVKEVNDGNDEDIMSIVVETDDGGFIDGKTVYEGLQDVEKDFHEELKDVKVDAMVPGRASDLPPRSSGDLHYGLLITLIVLLSVCLFSIFFCCFCIRCCPNQAPSSEKTPMTMEEARPLHKQPIVMSSPYTDDELVKGESPPVVAISAGPGLQSAPPSTSNNQSNPRGSMREKQDPSVTRNGGGQHISKPEDEYEFGIVPLEQLSKTERSQTDVENTKF